MNRRALLFRAWLRYVPALAAGLILAYSVQVYAHYLEVGSAISVPAALGIAAVDIGLWLLLSPVIVAIYAELAGKYQTGVHLALQIPAAIFFAVVHVLLDGLVNVLGLGPFPGDYMQFLRVFFVGKFFINVVFYLIIVLACAVIDYRLLLAGMSARLEPGEHRHKQLTVHDGHRRIRVPLSDVVWLEAANNYVGVHSLGGTEITRDTLTHLDTLLCDDGFTRVHRGAIVNLEHVREWRPLQHGDGELTLSDGSTIRVSRRYKDGIKRWQDSHSA